MKRLQSNDRSFNKGGNMETIDNTFDPLWGRKTAAKYLGFAPATLAVWDSTKRYDLKPIKIGRSVRYRKSNLDKILDEQLIPKKIKDKNITPLN